MIERIERLPNWIRWILALPATFLGWFITKFLFMLGYSYYIGHFDNYSIITISYESTVCVVAALSILHIFVPKYKFISSLVIGILYGIVSVASGTLALTFSGELTVPLWKILLNCVLNICAVIYGCIASFKAEKSVSNKESSYSYSDY